MPATTSIPPVPIYRLNVKQYHRMIEAAVLTEDDPVELLEGWLVTKMPHNPLHDGTLTRIQKRVEPELGDDWFIRIQCPITTRDSEPEPDLAVVSAPVEKYFERHPAPFDTAMLIEVADTSLEHDRTIKGRLYARARIPIYWIINLPDRIIEVYTNPVAGKRPHFRDRKDYQLDEKIPLIIAEKKVAVIPVKELLPP